MAASDLELIRDGVVVRVIPVRNRPLRLGRHLDNDVILVDEDVSAHHAVVGPGDGGLNVRDLRSTNGTWLNGVRVASSAVLADGDELRLGAQTVLRVRAAPETVPLPLVIADLVAGTVHPVRGDRVVFGSGTGSTVQMPQAPGRAATLMITSNDELWLDWADVESRQLALGEIFEVAGRQFRIEAARNVPANTWVDRERARFAYELHATMDGPGGVVASLLDPATGLRHTFGAENRATFMYVLARKRQADLQQGLSPDEAGWMDDEDAIIAVWGKGALKQGSSNLSVILHRIRREVEAAGFDPSFIEKRRGAARVRLDTIKL